MPAIEHVLPCHLDTIGMNQGKLLLQLVQFDAVIPKLACARLSWGQQPLQKPQSPLHREQVLMAEAAALVVAVG